MAHRADPLNLAAAQAKMVPGKRGTLRFPVRSWAVLVVLALVDIAWLRWYLIEPLPNAPRVQGAPIRRSQLLWEALPEVIPGFPLESSLLYKAAGELSHVENLPQRLPIVLGAALIAAAAISLGLLVQRALGLRAALGAWERIPLAFGLGTTGLGLITLLLGRLALLDPLLIRLGLLGLIALPVGLHIRTRGWGLGVGDWVQKKNHGPQTVADHQAGGVPPSTKASAQPLGSSPQPDPQPPIPNPQPGQPDPQPPIPNLPSAPSLITLGLVAGPFLLVMMLGAMLPTYDYDALEYHLQGPKEYFLRGRIEFLEHNVYTSMPFSVEMLHLLSMVVHNDWWWGALTGQLMVALFAPAAAALVVLTAWHWGSVRAGWVAGVVYLTTPWVYRIAVFPYVEGPLCYFHAALVWTAWRAWNEQESDRARFWGLVGLLAGGAMACKYTALLTAVVPFSLLAVIAGVRQRSWRVAVAFGLGVSITIGPWLAKNVIDTGNPVYPLGYHVFGGRHWDEAREAKWVAVHGPKPVSRKALVENVIDVAGRSDWQSPLYAMLAPLALLRPGSRRRALVLWGYVAYIFGTWFVLTHRLDRFWLPLLPAAAVLAGLGADWMRSRAWTALLAAIMTFSIATNFLYDSTALAGFNYWTSDLFDLRLRVPRDLNPALTRLDAELPPGAKILLVGQAAVFHVRHPIVYNTVFNHEILETLSRGRSPAEVQRDLTRMGIDYVFVDWNEIARFRSPGNYGFTDFITPELFEGLVAGGALDPPVHVGLQQDLYQVRKS